MIPRTLWTASFIRLFWTAGFSRLVLIALFAAGVSAQGRVIVIGVDGFDHEVCKEYMDSGDLPALKALAESGSYIPLIPTNPAQSPVSWATLTTGRNPGSTGVNDFLRKRETEDGGVGAELALAGPPRGTFRCAPAYGDWVGIGSAALLLVLCVFLWMRRLRKLAVFLLVGVPLVVFVRGEIHDAKQRVIDRAPTRARQGDAVWDTLDRAGIRTMSVLAPMAFPAPKLDHGHLLCGLGVPDAMGTPGTVTEWREEPIPAGRSITPTGCRLRSIRDQGGGKMGEVTLQGPRPDPQKPRLEIAVDARVDRNTRVMKLGFDGESASVAEGAWSPFLEAKFKLPWFQSFRALARYRVIEAGPRVVLYQDPVSFDPRHQLDFLPITSPIEFGDELCADGLFDTLGWACATNPMQDEIIGEDTFLSDVAEVEKQRDALLWRSLRKPGWRMFFCVLSTPDRVQHMFWRDRDPQHPRHDAEAIRRRGDPIKDCYRRIDALIAKLRTEIVKPEDLLLVVSDHGFSPFRWQVNLNRFLAEEGYLVGTGDHAERNIETSLGGGTLFPGLDWKKTRAYSLGLGKIYVNGGDEAPSGRLELLNEIRSKLLALRHEGQPVVRSVKIREEIYSGAATRESADLIIGFERGFRVSWQCTLGNLDEAVIAPNRNLWSGDHCSIDPDLVPGVLFSSRRLDQERANVADVCPTIETELGVVPRPEEDGRALRFRPK